MSKSAFTTYVSIDSRSRVSSGRVSVNICPAYTLPRMRVSDPSFIARHFSSKKSLRVNSIEYRWCSRRARTGVCKLLLGYRNVCTFGTRHLTPACHKKGGGNGLKISRGTGFFGFLLLREIFSNGDIALIDFYKFFNALEILINIS